jgi:transcriptional regulator with XRE-family HTH domain
MAWTLTLGLGHVSGVRKKADPALGVLVRRFRQEREMTQETLAFEAGITASALSRIERGVNNPGWTTVREIASALSVSLVELARAIEEHDPAAAPRGRAAPRMERG